MFTNEIVVTDTLYTQVGDETIETVVEVATGLYDTTYVVTTVYDEYQVCDTTYHYPSDVLTNVPERIRVTDPYTSMFCIDCGRTTTKTSGFGSPVTC